MKNPLKAFVSEAVRTAVSAVLLASAAAPAARAGFLRVQGTAVVDSAGNEVILRGLGLGGWLVQEGYQLHVPGYGSPSDIQDKVFDLIGAPAAERFYRDFVRNYAAEEDFRRMAAWGFNSIRLPFHYRMFEPGGQAGVRPEDPFAFIDRVAGWCRANGLWLILDMHCAPGGQNSGNISDSDGIEARLWTDPANRDRTVEIWRAIARHFAGNPVIAGYDLLNEPVLPAGHSNAELKALYKRIRDAIRLEDPDHLIIIEGNWWASDFNGLTVPFDDQQVYSFHKYWDKPSAESIQKYLDLRERARRPLWMGESGENANAWFTAAVRLLERNRIGWNWWTHKKVESTSCPLSAPLFPEMRAVLDYWGGTRPRPPAAAAESALMEFADRLAIGRCDSLPDVVDALLRRPSDRSAAPYRAHPLPGVVPAAEFDFGEPGVAYSDEVSLNDTGSPGGAAWNSGGSFRNDGVDLEPSGSAFAPYDVGWIAAGEWLQFTVDAAGGGYEVEATAGAPASGGRFRILLDGAPFAGTLTIPSTGGWKRWQAVPAGEVTMTAGRNVIRFEALAGGFNLLSLGFRLVRPESTDVAGWKEVSPGLRAGSGYPNPFFGSVTVPLFAEKSTAAEADLIDSRGRTVRGIFTGTLPAGRADLAWDGRTGAGLPAASGAYRLRIRCAGRTVSMPLILMR